MGGKRKVGQKWKLKAEVKNHCSSTIPEHVFSQGVVGIAMEQPLWTVI